MAEPMAIDVGETGKDKKPSAKRPRLKPSTDSTAEERDEIIRVLEEEIQSLVSYFKEVTAIDNGAGGVDSSGSLNGVIAVLLEEKRCSYSRLAGDILEALKGRESAVTIAGVRSGILYVGQRCRYGVGSDDVDVLEDETESCLWCWETRDMKLLPKSKHGDLKVRRSCRKKISERITAISAMLLLLRNPSDCQNYRNDIKKASEKLSKVLNEADIRLLAERLTQKKGSESAEKEAKREEKLLAKQLEKKRYEEEKEKKKMDRELQKEKLQKEKEMKRLQEEAEKEEKRREKEDSEMRKQLKRKQEDLERDQRRQEKEEAELKKKRSLQKQASIMERFLQKKKSDSVSQNSQTASVAIASELSSGKEKVDEAATWSMDSALLQKEQIDMEEVRKSHLNSWQHLGRSIRSRKGQHWGLRRNPKTALVKELKLTSNEASKQDEEISTDSLVGGWVETALDDQPCNASMNFELRKGRRSKQLLQFDKSNRPAFYGVWPKKSHIVGPRHPFRKDPELDYDIDSDEEWEEEEPGESLSECDKDEEENLEEGFSKADDGEESDDGFFVPDGYLSENEGVQSNESPCNIVEDAAETSPSCKPEAESEEFSSWIRQLKHLHNLTERALSKNQPLIITNMMHEKAHLLSSDNLTGTSEVEQICLQALAMRSLPGGLAVELHSDDISLQENQEASMPSSKSNLLISGSGKTIPDSELPKFVSTIESCPYGMNKVLKALLQKFPNYSKSHLRNQVRQIADFVDNKWQLKKEILDKLGRSNSPEKTGGRTKSIAAFFSKRCMPPSGSRADPTKASPESSQKTSGSQGQQPAEVNIPQVPL